MLNRSGAMWGWRRPSVGKAPLSGNFLLSSGLLKESDKVCNLDGDLLSQRFIAYLFWFVRRAYSLIKTTGEVYKKIVRPLFFREFWVVARSESLATCRASLGPTRSTKMLRKHNATKYEGDQYLKSANSCNSQVVKIDELIKRYRMTFRKFISNHPNM